MPFNIIMVSDKGNVKYKNSNEILLNFLDILSYFDTFFCRMSVILYPILRKLKHIIHQYQFFMTYYNIATLRND